MQSRYSLSYLLLLLATLAACTADDLPAAYSPRTTTPRFVIRTNSPQTRVSYSSITASTFNEGDVLGAFVLDGDNLVKNEHANITYSNIQYRVVGNGTDGTQTLAPVLPQDSLPYSSGYRYIFYYPFREGTIYNNVTHTVQTDQRTDRLYELSDLLWDVATPTPGHTDDPLVEVDMDHAMSCIVLEVPETMLNPQNPQADMLNVCIMVSGIKLTATSLDELEGYYGEAETVDAETVQMQRFGDAVQIDNKDMYRFRVAIPAQTIKNGTGMFRIHTDQGTRTYTAAFSKEVSFYPGKYYRFTVTDTGLRFRGLIENLDNGGDYYYEY